MGGREAYERIRALGSEVPVIFMTGYSAEIAQSRFVLETGAAFIQKPYGIPELGHKVRQALDPHALT
jgi:FixJ family two-component response regulator